MLQFLNHYYHYHELDVATFFPLVMFLLSLENTHISILLV